MPDSLYDSLKTIFGAQLVDYWLPTGGCYVNTNGTSLISTDNVNIGSIVTAIKSAVIARLNGSATYRTARAGSRPAMVWGAADFNAYGGNWAASLTNGATLILLIKFGAATGNGGGIFGLTPDTATQPYNTPDGFYVSSPNAVSTFNVKRDDTIAGRAGADAPFTTNWSIVEITFDHSVTGTVNLAGYSSYKGVLTIRVDGGPPVAIDDSGYTDQTAIDAGYLSVGGRFSAYSTANMSLAGWAILDGAVPRKTMQRFYDRFVLPYFGSGVFPAYQTQTKFKERQRFSGVGLHCDFAKVPLDDFRAMGFKWVRQSVEGASYSNAGIDELIQYYEAAGIPILWQLTVTPVTAGVFFNPSARAQQICARYAAAGLATPCFALGNESIQLNYGPSFGGVEATCVQAYIDVAVAFVADMVGYDYHVVILNDEPPYALRLALAMAARGVSLGDMMGVHEYSLASAAEVNGTRDWFQKSFGVDTLGTEANDSAPTVSSASAIAWLVDVLANATVPTCYFVAWGVWNSATGGYPLYSNGGNMTYNGNGVGEISKTDRTLTLTTAATNRGVTLP